MRRRPGHVQIIGACIALEAVVAGQRFQRNIANAVNHIFRAAVIVTISRIDPAYTNVPILVQIVICVADGA